MLLLLRLALTKQFGSAGSANYIKIGNGSWPMQWPHAIMGRAEPIIFNRDSRLRMLQANSLTTVVILIIISNYITRYIISQQMYAIDFSN